MSGVGAPEFVAQGTLATGSALSRSRSEKGDMAVRQDPFGQNVHFGISSLDVLFHLGSNQATRSAGDKAKTPRLIRLSEQIVEQRRYVAAPRRTVIHLF